MIEKIYGKMKMTWQLVIILAVTTALLTALFLIIPVFKNTSFERMGVYLEAWFLFAIIIMSNCKTPVESAMKTFVFFLNVLQNMVYLHTSNHSDGLHRLVHHQEKLAQCSNPSSSADIHGNDSTGKRNILPETLPPSTSDNTVLHSSNRLVCPGIHARKQTEDCRYHGTSGSSDCREFHDPKGRCEWSCILTQ